MLLRLAASRTQTRRRPMRQRPAKFVSARNLAGSAADCGGAAKVSSIILLLGAPRPSRRDSKAAARRFAGVKMLHREVSDKVPSSCPADYLKVLDEWTSVRQI